MIKILVIFIFSLMFAQLAPAKTLPELPLLGQGQFKWYFLDVYEAKLWGHKTDDIYSKPLILELKYSRSFSGKDIVEQSLKELVSTGTSKSEIPDWRTKLLAIFVDVNKGDSIHAYYRPESGLTFYFNSSKELGVLAGAEHSKKFLDIWLGSKTNAPELRNKLLGNKI